MSILTAFFVGTKSDARTCLKGDFGAIPADLIVEAGGLTDLEVSSLFALAEGNEFDFDRHELEPVLESETALIYKLPKKFVTAMLALTDSQITEVCEKWSQTEEMQCEAEPLIPIVRETVRIVKSIDKGTALYFCCSL